MSEIELVKTAGTLVIGGGIGLGGKIIFEWLKERHNGAVQTLAPSPEPNTSNGKYSRIDCKGKHKEIDGRLKDIDICLVQHKGMIESHKERLDKGSQDFDDIKKSISSLDKSYAVLASKVK